MKAAFFAMVACAIVGTAYAGEDTAASDPETQCNEDVAALWLYANAHKSGHVTNEQIVQENAQTFAQQPEKRDRMNRLAGLAYNDPRFERFADQAAAEPFRATCADASHRFDPFNWNGPVPSDAVQ